jgi:hypothetical protein
MTEDGLSVRIPLHDRSGAVKAYTLVDHDDLAMVGQWRWCLNDSGYAVRGERVDRRVISVRLHRVILGLASGHYPEVDHINRDKLDNRRANLRTVTPSENKQNVPSNNATSSQYRGVHWNKKSRRWIAQVQISGKSTHVGSFMIEKDAADAARAFRTRLQPFAVD